MHCNPFAHFLLGCVSIVFHEYNGMDAVMITALLNMVFHLLKIWMCCFKMHTSISTALFKASTSFFRFHINLKKKAKLF